MKPVGGQHESPVEGTQQAPWRNAGWLISERLLRFLVSFLVSVAVTRYLGPAESGLLNTGLALAAMCAVLVDLGLDTILRREVIVKSVQKGELLGSAAFLRLGFLPIAGAIFGTIFLTQLPQAASLVVPLTLTLLAPVFLTVDSWFQSQTQARYSVWAYGLSLVLGVIARLVLLGQEAGVVAFAWVTGCETLVGGLLLLFFYHRSGERLATWRVRFSHLRLLCRDAWPFALINFAALFYTRIDVVMLSALRSEQEAGYYAAATRITELGYILPMILINSFFPLLARLHASDPRGFDARFQWLTSLVTALGLATALGASVGAHIIIGLIFGPAFAPAGGALLIGAWGIVFAVQGAVRSQWILLANLQHYALFYVLIGVAVNVGLNLFLIPRYGIQGAALTSVVTQCAVALLAPALFAPTRPSLAFLLNGFRFRGLWARLP